MAFTVPLPARLPQPHPEGQGPLDDASQASLTLQTARSHQFRFAPDLSITHGNLATGDPRRLPGPDSHRQAIVNLSLLRHVVIPSS